ncbi:MAG TPA: hypothetical protein VGQ54_01115 [Burkholderiales bacterium]|nr:hypothetical protein [Burkholderiales bacterium]
MTIEPQYTTAKARNWAGMMGVTGLLACLIGAFVDRAQLVQSYLFAWWFFLGISLGALANLMIHQLTGGAWGVVIRKPLEAASMAVPVIAVLFVPLAFGQQDLYVWMRPAQFADPALLEAKSWYLNPMFFWLRAIFYFAVWVVLALRLDRLLIEQSISSDPRPNAKLRATSIAGLILYALTVTFAAVDWIMSLTPQWYSTTFGLLVMLGQTLSAFAFAIACAALLQRGDTTRARGDASHFHDLGNLLLMFVMTWAYLAFTQYLIIWAADLPHEIAWYLPRTETSWKWIGLFLVVFHIAVPFLVLLFRFAKRNATLLGALAGALLFAHWADALWLVAPAFRGDGFRLHWTDFAATLGIGGIWAAAVLTFYRHRPGQGAARGGLALNEAT